MNLPINFPPLTWFDLGASLGICLGVLALIVGLTGFLHDRYRVRHHAKVLAEAREMVGLLQKEKRK